MRENAATMRSCIVEAELSPDLKRVFEIAWSRIASNDKLKEALIKYDRLLACRGLPHIEPQDGRQANSLSYLIGAFFSLSCVQLQKQEHS